MSSSIPPIPTHLQDVKAYDRCKPHFLVYSHTNYSEQQRKLSEVLYWYARQSLTIHPNHKEFLISRSQLKALAHIKATNYEQMKNALEGLQEISIKTNITNPDGSYWRESIVPFYSISCIKQKDNPHIFIGFKIAEEVLHGIVSCQQHNSFLANILLIPHLKGICHPIYHILRYEKEVHQRKETHIPIAIYRQLIGLKPTQYTRFRDLKRKKILPLKNLQTNPHIDIDSLEISFVYAETDTSNVSSKSPSNSNTASIPTHIVFTHQRKEHTSLSEEDQKAIYQLTRYQFSLAEILPYLQHPKMGASYVLEKVAGMEQQYQGKKAQVKSRKGLMKNAIEQNYLVHPQTDYASLQQKLNNLKQKG